MSDKENNIVDMAKVNETKANTKTNTKAKPYTLRKLDGEDLWPVLNIAAKALPDDLANTFMDIVMGAKTLEEVGGAVVVRMVKAIIQNLETVKEDVYAFLSDASNLSRDEIIGLGLLGVPRMIWDIYNAEKDFFEEQA